MRLSTTIDGVHPAAQLKRIWVVWTSGYLVLLVLAAFVLIVPNAKLLSSLSLYDSKRVVQIILLVISAGWICATVGSATGPLSTFSSLSLSVRSTLFALLAIGCISSALAPFPLYGLLEVLHLLLVAALSLSVAHVVRTEHQAHMFIVAAVTLSAALYVLSFSVGLAMSLASSTIQLWPSGYIGFEHIRFFNQFQTWSLPILALAPLMYAGDVRWKSVLFGLPCVAFWMLLIASGGRGSMLGILVAMAAVAFFFRSAALRWLRIQVGSAMLGAGAYFLLFKVVATTDASLLDRSIASDMGRFWYWNQALDMVKENWLLGIGPMHHAGLTTEFWSHPHNSLLLFVAEWGLPAAAMLLAIFAWALWAWLQQSRAASRLEPNSTDIQIRIALTASLVAASVHALFSGLTVMPVSQTMMALVVGWTVGLYIRHESAGSKNMPVVIPLWKRRSLAALLVVSVIIVSAVAVPDALRREQSEDTYVEQVKPKNFHPRYWRQGAFRY